MHGAAVALRSAERGSSCEAVLAAGTGVAGLVAVIDATVSTGRSSTRLFKH